jgi:hypothetical protein
VPEREAPRRRIPWQDLMEKRLRESIQGEYSPGIQTYRAPKELQPSFFLQDRKGARISRKRGVLTSSMSAIKRY